MLCCVRLCYLSIQCLGELIRIWTLDILKKEVTLNTRGHTGRHTYGVSTLPLLSVGFAKRVFAWLLLAATIADPSFQLVGERVKERLLELQANYSELLGPGNKFQVMADHAEEIEQLPAIMGTSECLG